MTALAVRLTETTRMWAHAVGPVAEWVAQQLWLTTRKRLQNNLPPTRLTQTRRHEAKAISPPQRTLVSPRAENLCRGCGKAIRDGRNHCSNCAVTGATERLANAARLGRVASRTPEARAKHVASRRRHAEACSAWDASSQPAWLTTEVYSERIQPMLASLSSSAIASAIEVSRWYAGRIREGYRPHPRQSH
jgi:hypothetical protein